VTPEASTQAVDNSTPYGALRFRTLLGAGEFAGPKGSPIHAGILDIDGTLQDFGSKASKKVLDWMVEVEKKYPTMVWLVITARTHEHDYQRSFDWLVKHVSSAFIGPFHRAADDPRYASEFKRELAQGFEDMGLYRIIAAADDNQHVIKMWEHWAETHFASADEFDLLKTNYTYPSWSSSPTTGGYGTPSSHSPVFGPHRGETWVNGYRTVNGTWVSGYWRKTEGNHRPAGTRHYATRDAYGWDTYDRWEAQDDSVQ
jgi:hypothetical protein